MPWIVQSGTEYSTGPQTFSFTNTVATIAVPNNAAAGDMVVFSTTAAGFTAGVVYFVIATGLTTAALQLSATFGGSAQVPNATTTATGTFEQIIVSDTTNFTFYAQIDTSAIAPMISAGVCLDVVEFRGYTYDTGQTTYIQTWKGTYQAQQINNQKAFPFMPSDAGIRITVKQLNVETSSGSIATASSVATFTNGSANIALTPNASTLLVGDTVFFTNSGGALPTPFAASQSYFVVTGGANFQVSGTSGGGAISATSAGTGTQTAHLCGRPYRWKLLKQ
jgi:hypothetical protein